jgi:hypothetical protein
MRLWGSIASSASGSDLLEHATCAARLDLMGIRQAADVTRQDLRGFDHFNLTFGVLATTFLNLR